MFRSIVAVAGFIVAATTGSSLSSSAAQAQTIYAPVQFQYGSGAGRYYYGGNDAVVFDRAQRTAAVDELTDIPYASRRYTSAYVHLRLIDQLDRVYSDAIPVLNARTFGYMPVDAANDAYANVPRYFRKGDLTPASVPQADGSVVVPAQARPIASDVARRPAARAAEVKPRAIIIIPKDGRTKKPTGDVTPASDKLVADASR